MIDNNLINDDAEEQIAARVVLTWLELGKREAKKISKKHVKNLDKGGWTHRFMLIMPKDATDIDLVMLILGARGFIILE